MKRFGGRDRVRTCDPLLAKQVLSQLSYTPTTGLQFILEHLWLFANSETRFLSPVVSELCENASSHHLLVPKRLRLFVYL